MSRLLLPALLVLAACGEVKTNKLPDAPSGSDSAGGSDSGSDGSHGKVTVKLLDPAGTGSGVVGAQVVFTDAQQTQRTVTDVEGKASADVLAGATVTVVGSQSGTPFLQTVFATKPGDVIVLGESFNNTQNTTSFTVNFTPVSGVTGSYQVFGPCGSTGVSTGAAVITLNDTCKTDPMEILIVGTNATTGASLGSLVKSGIPFAANGSTTITGAFQPLLSFTGSYTNAALTMNINLQRSAPDSSGFIASNSAVVANGDATIAVSVPKASTAVVESDIDRTGFGQQRVFQRLPGDSLTYDLDVQATVLPWLGPPAFDAASATVQVPLAADGASSDLPDLFFAELAYQRAAQADGGNPVSVVWLLFAPKAGDLVLPTLPPEVGDLAPAAGDRVFQLNVGELETDVVNGYDQGRLDPYHLADALFQSRAITGRARQSTSFSGAGN